MSTRRTDPSRLAASVLALAVASAIPLAGCNRSTPTRTPPPVKRAPPGQDVKGPTTQGGNGVGEKPSGDEATPPQPGDAGTGGG